MNRLSFAKSSVLSMAGLFVAVAVQAGCSDSPSTQTSSAATEPTETKKPNAPAPNPSGPNDDDTNDTPEAPKTCMDTKPFDATTVPYHSPAVKPGSCTAADLKVFDDYLKDHPQASVEAIEETMTKQSKTCSSCIFGASDDEKWAPIISDGTGASFNGGGCVSVVSGKDECGKAYQQWNTCLNEVCASCTDANESNECKNDAQAAGSACGAASKVLLSACGSKVNDYLKKCFSNGLGTAIEQVCGSPAKDKDGGA